MKIKAKILVFALLGCIGIANAFEIGDEVNEDQATIFDNIATEIYRPRESAFYQIDIYAISTKKMENPQNIKDFIKLGGIKVIDKKLWTITREQLPITEYSCMVLGLTPCDQEGYFCFKPCFSSDDPVAIAFDNKNKKIYLNYPTENIGTGGGPSLLFVGDLNKREIKFLKSINWGEKGSVSPSGHYFMIHGHSMISLYNTETNVWFKMNESENDYSHSPKYIIHNLILKKWISDTQFIYIDRAKYFTRPVEPMPFISAKEVTYDITTKTKLSEKAVSKNEYEQFIKSQPKYANYLSD